MSDVTAKLIGTIPPADAGRDAIHVAVVPAVAAKILAPGEPVALTPGGMALPARSEGATVGVVDPFLKTYVKEGERFWLFLPPGSITSLRHVWTHPAFTEEATDDKPAPVQTPAFSPKVEEARKWLEEFAPQVEMDYDRLIAAATDYLEHDEYVTEYGGQSWQSAFYDVAETFWNHYETVTGRTVKDRGHFFSCSC
jgi:hypothetical protein